MAARSIRFRLTLWYAVILSAALALFSGLLWISLRHQLLADIDRDLAGRADRLESYFRTESTGPNVADELEEFCQAFAPGSFVDLRGSNGFAFQYPFRDSSPQRFSRTRGEFAQTRTLRRTFALNGARFDLQVGAPTADIAHVLDLLRLLLVSLVPVIILVACLGGAWLSRRALKPVQDVTAAAVLIGIENLAGRVPVPPTGDEIARLAEVLNSMLARLEAAVKMLSQFAGDVSHELRTPLAVIRTTAELALRRGRTPESYRESLQSVTAEAERMTTLVEDLLASARTGNAAAEMPRAAVDLRELVREVCHEIEPLAETREIQVKTFLNTKDAAISGNRPALHRLLLVLLDNALKFSEPGSQISVRLEEAEKIQLIVQDSGRGIKETDLPRIFERFYKAEGSQGGLGLGLPLAQDIAKAHGAVISVESREGHGAIFRVEFPRRGLLRSAGVETAVIATQ